MYVASVVLSSVLHIRTPPSPPPVRHEARSGERETPYREDECCLGGGRKYEYSFK